MADRYENFTRSELLAELRDKENALRNWRIKPDPTEENKKQAQQEIIEGLENVVKVLEDKVKSKAITPNTAHTIANQSNQTITPNNQMITEWSRAHKRQLINQDVSAVGKLVISNLERWISEIDRVYKLEIEDDASYSEDFCKMVKRLLPSTIYSQVAESEADTGTWTNLRSHLILNFGSKISIYQHLTKLNDLEMGRNENVSTFAAKLEEQLYVASMHIMKKFREINKSEMSTQQVFKVIGAMLLSIQIRNNHPNVYRSMVRSMDKHWCANTLAAECQDYLDRLGPSYLQNQTYIAQESEKSRTTSTNNDKKKFNKQRRGKYTPEQLTALKEKVKDQVCHKYEQTGHCPYKDKCFRKHIKRTFMAMEHVPMNRDSRFDQLFEAEAAFMVEVKDRFSDAKHNRPTTAYVQVTIATNDGSGLVINGSALIDSGSSVTIIPEDILTSSQLKYLKPSTILLQGINSGDSNIIGQMTADLKIGSSCIFKDQTIYVSRNNVPIIIGSNILADPTVERYGFDYESGQLRMKRYNNDQEYKFKLIKHASFPAQIQKSREEKLKILETKGIKLPEEWNHDEKNQMIDILYKHQNVFGCDGGEIGTYKTPVRIPTKEGESKAVYGSHVPQSMEKMVDADIKEMLKKNVIEECKDPKGWSSPVFAVRKADGSIRTVANFKPTLNRCLVDLDPYEMPNIERLFSKIGMGNQYFAKLDLKSGFWQIEIDERDRHKTAFMWNNQTYQYRKLAFGLTTAGQIFSRAISEALSSIENKQNISTYVDDHLVCAKDFQSFIKALEELLKALDSNGLKLNPKKCQFLAKEAEFLGRICGPYGYKPNPEYVQGIDSITPPTNKKQLKGLIGKLTWIRQFAETRLDEPVKGSTFADLMKPIHNLTKGSSETYWDKAANKALNRIKSKLSKNPIISFVDFNLPFHITTDASTVAAGAVLSQITPDSPPKIRICGVASTTLSPTQMKWSATEREAYALKWGIEKFHYFLSGRSFLAFTDHKALQYLDRKFFKNPKIKRWQDQLSEYNFVVQYIEGESNCLADMLSRPNNITSEKTKIPDDADMPMGKHLKLENTELFIYIPSWAIDRINEDEIKLITKPWQFSENKEICCFFGGTQGRQVKDNLCGLYHDYADEQTQDYMLNCIIKYLRTKDYDSNCRLEDFLPKNDGRSDTFLKLEDSLFLEAGTSMLLRKTPARNQYLVPESLVSSFLHKAHDLCNHSGISRVESNLAAFYWPGKSNDIKTYIDSCSICAQAKGNYGRVPQWQIGHVKRGNKCFEVLTIDFVHMPKQKGKQYILSMICSFSRYYMALPCANADAISAARGLFKVFLTHRVIPTVISSDRGSHFTGELTKQFCDLMGIRQELHVPWRPQSSGNVERCHRTLKNALFILCNERNQLWPDLLEEVVSNMNAQPNKSTKVSPYYVVTGRHPAMRLPQPDEDIRHTDQASYGMLVHDRIRKIGEATRIAAEEADLALERRLNKQESTPELEIGSKVLLYRPESSQAKSTKLPWIPGFTVIQSNGMVIQVETHKTRTR